MASLRANIVAFGILAAIIVYLVGDFPPPPGQLIGAVLSLVGWAVWQVMKLLPGEFVSRFFYANGRPANSGLFFGGTAVGIDADPVVAAALAVAGFLVMRGNHRQGEHLIPEKASR